MLSKTKNTYLFPAFLLFIISSFFFLVSDTHAASTTSIAGTVADADVADNCTNTTNGIAWETTLSEYQVDDGTNYGTYGSGNSFDASEVSTQLRLSNFHLSSTLVSGSVVNGITVNINRKGTANDVFDFKVWLMATTTAKMGSNHAKGIAGTDDWGTSDATVSYGGTGDLWSLNNTTGAATSTFKGSATSTSFGLILCVQTGSGDVNALASVDFVSIDVDYTLPALTQDGYRWRANHQGETGTTWLAAEDTVITGAGNTTASTTRLRMLIDETASVATTTLYQLEYATSTSAGCSGLTYVPVADQASSTSYAWKMSPTSQFANGGASTNVASGLTDPTGSFRAGVTQDTVARLSSGISHSAGEFTELEWSIEGTSRTNGQSYCFRVTNADSTTNITYSAYPKINMASTTALSQAHYRWRANNGGQGASGATASPWWDSNFLYRRKITFNNAPSAQKLTNFPMPIKLTEDANDEWSAATIEYDNVLAHGNDIRFVTATTSQMMKHEIESWDTAGTSTIWVKLPWIEAGTTTQHIWMYYGNSATTTGAATSSVWDANFVGVWHLAATSTAARKFGDSTSNANNGIGTNFDSDEYTVSGRINSALDFDSTNDYVDAGTGSSLSFTASNSTFTLSAWGKNDTSSSDTLVGRWSSVNSRQYLLFMNDTPADNVQFNLSTDGAVSAITLSGATTLSLGVWNYFAATADLGADSYLVYANGKQDGSNGTALGTLFNNSSAIVTMGVTKEGTDDQFDGVIDEVRISNIVRSADWIQQEYRYGAASSTTHSFGSEEVVGGGASFLVGEDVHLTGASVATASTTRLRILMDETTGLIATTTVYQLEYATSTVAGFSTCSALSTWIPVADQASSTSYAWKMSPSAQFANAASTGNNSGLTDPTGTFTTGEIRDSSNRTSAISLSAGKFTELEWSLEATSEADGDSYCFRVTNADSTANITYSAYGRISIATSSVSFTQNTFRLYKDNDSLNPTTAWDGLSENTVMSSSNERVGGGDVVRIRMNVTAGSALTASSQAFEMQYAELPSGSSCSSITVWNGVGTKGSDSVFRLANTGQGDSSTITTTLLSTSDVGGLLSELNPSATNPNSATANQDIEYDWPVQYASARLSGTSVCFRMVKASGTVFSTYSNYPQILTNIVGSGADGGIGAPVGGAGAKGAATTTGGTQGGGGDSGAGGGGQQSGGGSGGGGEVRIPMFRYFAGVLLGAFEFIVRILKL